MTEKRFRANFDVSIYDSEKEEYISVSERGLEEIAKIMNEQQATIQSLKEGLYDFEKRKIIEESAIDEDVIPRVKLLRAELFGEKRFEFYSDDYLIGVLDTVTGKTFNSFEIVDCLNGQQAIIEQLQDLCGQSDGENAKLRIENKRLQEENMKLKNKLNKGL